jgi:hypothetical protein
VEETVGIRSDARCDSVTSELTDDDWLSSGSLSKSAIHVRKVESF